MIITEDGLSSNGPHIEELKQLNFRYILGCKPGDHTHLFEFIEESDTLNTLKRITLTDKGNTLAFRYMSDVECVTRRNYELIFLNVSKRDAMAQR